MLSRKQAIAACCLAAGSIGTGFSSPAHALEPVNLRGVPRNRSLEALALRYNPAIRPVIIDYSQSGLKSVPLKDQIALRDWLEKDERLPRTASDSIIRKVKDTILGRDYHTIDAIPSGKPNLRISIFGPSRTKDKFYPAFELGLREPESLKRLGVSTNPESLAFLFKLHEVGHLIDTKHPHLPGTTHQQLGMDHKAELFCDVFATLVCIRDFPRRTGSLEFLKLARKTGPYFASEPREASFFSGNPLLEEVKYFTAQGIEAAQEEGKKKPLAQYPPDRIVLLAHSITDRTAYSSQSLATLSEQLNRHHNEVGNWATIKVGDFSYRSFTFSIPEHQRISYAQDRGLLPGNGTKVHNDLIKTNLILFTKRR